MSRDAASLLRLAFVEALDAGAAVDDVSVRALCRSAGVAPSSFARAFATKKRLAWEVLDETWFDDQRFGDDVGAWIDHILDVAEGKRVRLRALSHALGRLRPRPPRKLLDRFGAAFVHATHMVGCGVALGEPPPRADVRAHLMAFSEGALALRPGVVDTGLGSPFSSLPPVLAAVLEGSARVVADDGVAGATIRRIARVAGVGTGTLYAYFAGKDALLQGLLDQLLTFAAEQLVARADGVESHASVEQVVGDMLAVPAGMARFSPLLRALVGADDLPHALPMLLAPPAVMRAIAFVATDGKRDPVLLAASWTASTAAGVLYADVSPTELAALFVRLFEPLAQERDAAETTPTTTT
ncbi:MAG: helix-turn-helix domain-containing protein [Deltaproteobacteria bacterium]|nr:helix-turn-helix domain-containing protein [Deltaproteobacteria bacterium]